MNDADTVRTDWRIVYKRSEKEQFVPRMGLGISAVCGGWKYFPYIECQPPARIVTKC